MILTAINHVVQKKTAFDYARSLTSARGIINLGATGSTAWSWEIANDPLVALNVDISPEFCCPPHLLPKFLQWDLNTPLPLPDKSFDVAYASHVLEHLDNWQLALGEMFRVADNVVLVLPHPLSLMNYLNEDHKQHFSFDDILQWEQSYTNLKVFT